MRAAEDSTVIGKSVTIRGELSGGEDIFMDGAVEGVVTLREGRLTVGPNARVIADIHVRDLVVFGAIEGEIRATGRIELRASAVVTGKIFAGRMSIEENACICGRVELSENVGAEMTALYRPEANSSAKPVYIAPEV
jgi:cytoskeletal protein CcmA (bactofilin family)